MTDLDSIWRMQDEIRAVKESADDDTNSVELKKLGILIREGGRKEGYWRIEIKHDKAKSKEIFEVTKNTNPRKLLVYRDLL